METLSLLLVLSVGTCAVLATEVIVIGAGASGLAAARALTNDGTKVTVLEARKNRYGGRIWTNTESFPDAIGPEVDMGASFIHHPDDTNSVVKLHREFNLPMLEMKFVNLTAVRQKDSKPYTPIRIASAGARVEKAFETVGNLSASLKADISVYEALRQTNQSQFIDDPLSQMFVALEEFDFGSPINKLSTKSLNVGYKDVSDETEKIPAYGYGRMLDKIVKSSSSENPINISYGQVVTQVTVRDNRRVVIKCRNNETFEADAVIVTLPLGVLKAGSVTFTPGLPKRKRSAIKRIGFGVVNKLVLEFDRRFWSVSEQHFTIAMRNIADRGKFSLLTSFHSIANKPVLVAYAVSHFGKQSEKLTDKQLKNLALERLRTIFGTVMDSVMVVRMARTKWYKDPYARGSYSFPAVETRDGDWDVIGEPVPPLFFAGEHTRTVLYGTVQTAIDTGRKAASEVKLYLEAKPNDSSCKALSYFVVLSSLILSVLYAYL